MKKRIFCALMAAGMMALSLTACGNDGGSSSSSSESSTDSSASASESSDGSEAASTGDTKPGIDMEGDPYHCIVMYLNTSSEGDGYNDVAAAVNELGYCATKGGYSKYGEWGGSAYGEWCSEFVSWCVNFADEYYGASMLGNDYPLQTSCEG